MSAAPSAFVIAPGVAYRAALFSRAELTPEEVARRQQIAETVVPGVKWVYARFSGFGWQSWFCIPYCDASLFAVQVRLLDQAVDDGLDRTVPY